MTAGCSSGSCDIWREALRMHNAHGYHTLSLAPIFTEQVMSLEGLAFAINYGLNKVLFPAPVPVGSRVRARVELASLEEIPGGAQITLELTFETEGGEESNRGRTWAFR